MPAIKQTGEHDFQRLLNEQGSWVVDKVRLVREPLPHFISSLGTKLGVGKIPAHHDRMYHLYNEFALRDPVTGKKEVIQIEKNQRINVKRGRPGGLPDKEGLSAHEVKIADKHKGKVTLLDWAEHNYWNHHRTGLSFEKYSLGKSNCQRFALLGLTAFGKLDNEAVMFAEQRADKIVPQWMQTATKGITDFAAWIDRKMEDPNLSKEHPFRPPQIPYS